MLNAKPAPVYLDAPDVGNLLAVYPGLDVGANYADMNLVPVVIIEKLIGGDLEFCGLFWAFRVEPPAESYPVNAAVFPGCGTLDFALIAFRFSIFSNNIFRLN